MTTAIKTATLSLAAFSFAACTTTGNVERNAAYGAAAGAVAGAVIGNNTGDGDAGEGAAIGAAIGAGAGAVYGYGKDQKQGAAGPQTGPVLDRSERFYDNSTGRYYFREVGTQRTFYENGDRRS